jgi:sodium/potassium-transporting ATPase subunit alpha
MIMLCLIIHAQRDVQVRVTMVTGDHALTAEAIARKCGIITLPTRREVAASRGVPESAVATSDEDVHALVVTGGDLAALEADTDWDAILAKVRCSTCAP